ncbi:hypothetical protein RCL1_008521 [Eukaryota sp. TZLM3-RCL]
MSDWEFDEEPSYAAALSHTATTTQQKADDSDVMEDWEEFSEEEQEEKVTDAQIADYETTKALLSATGIRATGDPAENITAYEPIAAADFETLGKAIGKKITKYIKDPLNFDSLLRQVMTTATVGLDSETVRRYVAHLSTIANQKLADEKAAKGGKKKKGKAPSLAKERAFKKSTNVLELEEDDGHFDGEYDDFM